MRFLCAIASQSLRRTIFDRSLCLDLERCCGSIDRSALACMQLASHSEVRTSLTGRTPAESLVDLNAG